MSSIDSIPDRPQPGFPSPWLTQASRVLVVEPSRSKGRADLLHLHRAGIKEVTVLESNQSFATLLGGWALPSWEIQLAPDLRRALVDAVSVKRWDLVSLDGPTGSDEYTLRVLAPLVVHAARRVLMRLTGEFVVSFGVDPADSEGFASLISRLMGLPPPTASEVHIGRRSGARKGVYWVGLPHAGSAALLPTPNLDSDRTPLTAESYVQLFDRLDDSGCAGLPRCRKLVNEFRSGIERKERQNIWRAFTTSRLSARIPEWIAELAQAIAVVRLDRFSSAAEVAEAMRVVTSKPGRVTREIAKATRAGYLVARFDRETHVPDLHEIHNSKEVRGGKPLRASYKGSLADMKGPAAPKAPPPVQPCPLHRADYWGVFAPVWGYMQEGVRTDRRLVGYVARYRFGNHAWYSRIMGHGDFLQDGIMYLLHVSILENAIVERSMGLEYLIYGAWNSGPPSGSLRQWKRRALFEPRWLLYDEAGDWLKPDGVSLLDVGEPGP